ncbi:MAG: ATP-binding cassette domain-containing protein [Nakamurella sp.]
MASPPVLSATGITKVYGGRRSGRLHALDGVDVTLGRGEILGIVGESGSGKSTLGKVLVGAIQQDTGRVLCDGQELALKRDIQTRRRIQMIYQDPYSSLNPRMTIRSMLAELLRVHAIVTPTEIPTELSRLMGLVGLDDSALDAYPRQFSGGQRSGSLLHVP